jgi:hypothetical protein
MPDDGPLLLERGAIGQVQFDLQRGRVHQALSVIEWLGVPPRGTARRPLRR